METSGACISVINCFMKKILIPFVLLLIGKCINAQPDIKEPPPPPPPKVNISKFQPPVIDENLKEFYVRNPSISDIARQGNIITLKKKDGTMEQYDMNKKEEDRRFTELYGVSPIPQPPPPPKVKSKA